VQPHKCIWEATNSYSGTITNDFSSNHILLSRFTGPWRLDVQSKPLGYADLPLTSGYQGCYHGKLGLNIQSTTGMPFDPKNIFDHVLPSMQGTISYSPGP
jgi:hypothetical protein